MKTNKNNDLDRTEHTRNVTRTKSAPLLRSRFSSGKNQDILPTLPRISRALSMPLNSIREEDTSGQNDMPLTLPKR